MKSENLIIKTYIYRHVLGPFYTMVEKSIGRSKNLARDMVIWGEGWYAEEDEKRINYFIQVGVLRSQSFLYEALRLPKKLDLRRTPLQKKCYHVGNHVIFHPCTKFSTKGLLTVV